MLLTMVNKEAFAKRVQILMDYHEISAASLADKVGVQRSSISHLLSGRNNPSLDFILKILDNYPHITFEWFVKGVGSIASHKSDSSKPSSTPTLFNEDKDDKKAQNKAFSAFSKKMDSSKSLEKILLLYTDGSFEVYKEF